jgi:hypothetical protein
MTRSRRNLSLSPLPTHPPLSLGNPIWSRAGKATIKKQRKKEKEKEK